MSAASKQKNVFIVGLAGPSGSGKSTIAKHLASRLNGDVLSMEIYSADMNHLPLDKRSKLDYDIPEAIDVKLLESHIRDYAAGKVIEAPIYDFAQHLRVKERRQPIAAKSFLIVEGILALHFAQLRPHFDFSIYLEAPEEVCSHRRKVRDITERQRPIELILWQYQNTVLPAARRYLFPSKIHANLVQESTSDVATVGKCLAQAIIEKRAGVGQ
jgi:uridine kinase